MQVHRRVMLGFLGASVAVLHAFALTPTRRMLLNPGNWWRAYGTSVVYVSNAPSNSFGLGNDTAGNGTKAAPYLTINKAVTVAVEGAVVVVNPSGLSYAENSGGSLYLGMPNKALTVIGDITATGKPRLVCTSTATRVVNIPSTAKAISFNNMVLDGTGTSSGNIVEPNNQTGGGLSFVGVDFRNASRRAIDAFVGSSNVLNIKGCTFDTSVVTAFTADGSSLGFASLIVTGNTFTGTGSATGIQVSGQATITALTFSYNNATGTFNQAVCYITGNSTVTALTAQYNAGGPSKGMINSNSENVGATEISHNLLSTPSGAGFDPILISPAGTSSISVHDNIITVNTSTSIHGIAVGPDGYRPDSQNTTATGTQNLGDLVADTYVDQAFTTSTAATSGRSSYFAGVLITLKKTGSPTGVISAGLYADNAGVPGTLIETSVTTVSGNSPLVTTSAQQFFFEFASHNKLTAATLYHIVLKYTGTNNNTDYIILSKNATVTGGSLSTSANGTVWVNDATHALLYVIDTGCFGTTSINIYNNAVTMTAGSNVTTHGILLGAVNFTAVYRNQVYGGGICLIAKNCYAGLMYDNLGYTAIGTLEVIRLKGSFNIQVYQNSGIQGAASGTAVAFRADNNNENGVNSPVSSNFDVRNNIFACVGTGYVYSLGAGATGTVNNNAVWNAPGSSGIEQNAYATWAAWQGAGFDVNGINSNPLLPGEAGASVPADFIPPSNSPVAGIGANLSATVPADFNSVPFSTTPPAGAFNLAA